jgi:hypothetical protein
MSATKVSLKILLILLLVSCFGFLLRAFGFQFLNSLVVTSSAPPANLDQRLVLYIVIMSLISLIILKDWIKK